MAFNNQEKYARSSAYECTRRGAFTAGIPGRFFIGFIFFI